MNNKMLSLWRDIGLVGLLAVALLFVSLVGAISGRTAQTVFAENNYQVCHNGSTLDVASEGAYNGHLEHGDTDGPCAPEPVLGCMDSDATNYNPDATQDDGSCTYPDNDSDDDTILDDVDNCVNTPNTNQADADNDGIGDVCDDTPNGDPIDVCPNIEGNQDVVPDGYHLEDGQCVENSIEPTDMCPNIDGVQETVPEGMEIREGQCVTIVVPPTDVCPNIEGVQETVPEGKHLEEGMCVDDVQTTTMCSDGIDNDEDGLSDLLDPGCTDANDNDETDPVDQDEPALCEDGIDNDEDGLIDMEDPGCSSPEDNDETNRRRSSGGGSSRSSLGEVLGASTSCGIYVEKFMRKDYPNDAAQVTKLQTFLRDYLKIALVVDGSFGAKTEAAVRQFQTMHSDEVLTPWGISKPTGIAFRTTIRKVNDIMCPDLKLPIPTNLVSWNKDPETRKK